MDMRAKCLILCLSDIFDFGGDSQIGGFSFGWDFMNSNGEAFI